LRTNFMTYPEGGTSDSLCCASIAPEKQDALNTNSSVMVIRRKVQVPFIFGPHSGLSDDR
jgi:hypothetical protein